MGNELLYTVHKNDSSYRCALRFCTIPFLTNSIVHHAGCISS